MKTPLLIPFLAASLFSLVSCPGPPDRPVSLWDQSMPPGGKEAPEDGSREATAGTPDHEEEREATGGEDGAEGISPRSEAGSEAPPAGETDGSGVEGGVEGSGEGGGGNLPAEGEEGGGGTIGGGEGNGVGVGDGGDGVVGGEEPDSFLVINEIYYDAVGADTDGHLFIELFGTPGLALGGYRISLVNGADGKIYDQIEIPEARVVGPDGFFLIADARDGSESQTQVGGADLIDSFDPQNGPDGVQLIDRQGTLIDAVGYGEGIVSPAANLLTVFEGTPTADVGGGHSLERRSPGEDLNDNLTDFVDREPPTPGF